MADTARTPHPDADWWRQAVVYQIYPRSFADNDGDGIGNIAGVTAKIPYLQALGVDAVWLSPFYPSALADGGYDVDDYRDVDPKLGTLADFDEMSEKLHAAGIRLIVDIVPNHSSDRHVWFQEALASEKGSKARARYVFRDGLGPDGAEPPSDWVSHFGGSAWTRVPDGQWYLHLFAPEQPDFDWSNPEVREDFRTTLRFWSDRGVDGFRVDVAHGLAKDLSEPLRSMPSIPQLELPIDGSSPLFDRDEVHTIFAEWREVFNEYDPPRAAVAEAWVPAPRRALYARPTELGQAFNFDLLRQDWDAAGFRKTIAENLALSEGSGASSTWVLSNHDVVRHRSRYGLPQGIGTEGLDRWLLADGAEPVVDDEAGLRRATASTLLLLALPGSMYLYQGEELGLREVPDIPRDQLADPIWLRTGHTLKGRDGCRVPLPWSRTRDASGGSSFGFGRGGAHLPQPDWFGEFSVEAEDADPDSVLNLYRTALRLRREHQGAETLEWVDAPGGDHDVLHLRRPGGWEVVTNFGTAPVPLPAGQVLVASQPLDGETLPGETTVWLHV
ncbi:glycoside hydrolase family 13 protein [Kineosporia succinea]|uniref:Alpha-glucosidase n=1 Tax=Kineosporia succinea TaxID=84632 RepID=A0ABT9P150_9ACTN|nr:glycoside hydrolase family 13 protein [Kineosporia succinea]MDP9826232.1 alpha-glucosidase [Kineosporia succinea]